jgi:hypothetical protein
LYKTRQKLKEAYAAEFAATIERAEKQILLAKHGRRLLNLLDDTPVVPGNVRAPFEHAGQARQILADCEDDLRDWQPNFEEVGTSAQYMGTNLMPSSTGGAERLNGIGDRIEGENEAGHATTTNVAEGSHLAGHNDTGSHIASGGSVATGPTYATSESEAGMLAH